MRYLVFVLSLTCTTVGAADLADIRLVCTLTHTQVDSGARHEALAEDALVTVIQSGNGKATVKRTDALQKVEIFQGEITAEEIGGHRENTGEIEEISINRYTGSYIARQRFKSELRMGEFKVYGTCKAVKQPKF